MGCRREVVFPWSSARLSSKHSRPIILRVVGRVGRFDHAGTPSRLDDWSSGARLLGNLGSFHRSATTRSVEAQRFFDQGMRLLWAFNHDEAARSFVRAAQLDADCAACWWGASLALGPNYNT